MHDDAARDMGRRLTVYHATTLFSVLFALVGFSYNVWRMENSEHNSNIRTASFEILLELAALEQLVYLAAYDGDLTEGSPRRGWVKVGLIADLGALTAPPIAGAAEALRETWARHWETMTRARTSTDAIVTAIDKVRREVKRGLRALD